MAAVMNRWLKRGSQAVGWLSRSCEDIERSQSLRGCPGRRGLCHGTAIGEMTPRHGEGGNEASSRSVKPEGPDQSTSSRHAVRSRLFSPYSSRMRRNAAEMENPYILIFEKSLHSSNAPRSRGAVGRPL